MSFSNSSDFLEIHDYLNLYIYIYIYTYIYIYKLYNYTNNYMNKIKTRRSPGTKILGVPGIKKVKMI